MKYFKHDLTARSDDKIWELIEKHGVQGYGIWWVILEELYRQEENGFQVAASESWFKRLSKELNLTDWRTLIRVLDTMAELGLIDNQLWQEHTISAPGIAKRAESYVRQKELARERKRKQREKLEKLLNVTSESRVTSECHAVVTTNIDVDLDIDLDLSKKEIHLDDFASSIVDGAGDLQEENQVAPSVHVPSEKEPQKQKAVARQSEFNDESFEQFWESVPLKANKKNAKAKFLKIKGITFNDFMASYECAKRVYRAARPDGNWQYFKRADAWINQRCWEDEAIASKTPSKANAAKEDQEFEEWQRVAKERGLVRSVQITEGSPLIEFASGRCMPWMSARKFWPIDRIKAMNLKPIAS